MKKLIFLLKRKPGISKEQFRAHYETSHVKLAKGYIGHLLAAYERHYPLSTVRNPTAPDTSTEAEYDVITEMTFKSEEAFAELFRILEDPAINPVLVEDELKFLDRESVVMMTCEVVNNGTQNPS